jgi:inner membrane protein
MAIADGNEILWKGGILVVMCVLLLIPLGMLHGLIAERTALREQAYQRVANGYGGAQTVGGPVIVVPVGEKDRRLVYLLPDELEYAVALRPAAEPRRVGIFDVPAYEARVEIRGRFDRRSLRARLRDVHAEEGRWNEATVLLPISDVRGIRDSVAVEMPFVYGDPRPSQEPGLSGLVLPLVTDAAQSADGIEFHITETVGGSRAFGVLPLGARTTLTMNSSWPHPSFKDTFLPAVKTIRSDGFDARWVVLEVNRSFGQGWLADDAAITNAVTASAFGVDLYQPVDAYQRADRAVKYAGLFIALTFMAFFCYERAARVRMHPFQYGLVGLALSVFYLLLLALGEHLAFGVAYAIAATALVLLLGSYVAGALRSRAHGAFVAATFALVYALLYALIASEDYALLVGALAVFGVLATSMLLTRRVDWYAASAA